MLTRSEERGLARSRRRALIRAARITRRNVVKGILNGALAARLAPRSAWARMGRGGSGGSQPAGTFNPIGINLSAGGASALSYEGMALFQDGIKSGGQFKVANTSTPATTDSAGWPTQDFTIGLTSSTGQSWVVGSWSCGYFSKGNGPTQFGGSEVIAASGKSGLSITVTGYNATTKYVTFTLNVPSQLVAGDNVDLTVTGTASGATQIVAYLPGYASNFSYGYQDVTPANVLAGIPIFTNEAISHLSQFGWIRFMDFFNAWNNTASTSWSTRNTSANTKTSKGWANSEGYPVEWGVACCVRCNQVNPKSGGGWFHIPAGDDGTYASGLATYCATWMPVGLPQFFEDVNEIWNPTGAAAGQNWINRAAVFNAANPGMLDFDGYTITAINLSTPTAPVVTFSSSATSNPFNTGSQVSFESVGGTTQLNGQASTLTAVGGVQGAWTVTLNLNATGYGAFTSGGVIGNAVTVSQRYLGYRQYVKATALSTAFGARFGTDAYSVLAWQKGNAGQMNTALSWLVRAHGSASNYVHWMAVAPYLKRDNTIAPSSDTPYGGTNWTRVNSTVADIEGQLATNAAYQTWNSGAENYLAMALHYGMKGLISYENGWETGGEGNTPLNIGTAIMDSGMEAVTVTQIERNFDSGMTYNTWFKGGAILFDGPGGSSYGCNYRFTEAQSDLVASPPLNSPRLLALQQFFTNTAYTPQRNVVQSSGTNISWANCLDSDPTRNGQPTLASNATVYMPGFNGYRAMTFYIGTAGTYSLGTTMTSGGTARTTNVEIDGTQVASNVAIAANLTAGRVGFGSFALTKGWHEITVGNGNFYSDVTLNSLVN